MKRKLGRLRIDKQQFWVFGISNIRKYPDHQSGLIALRVLKVFVENSVLQQANQLKRPVDFLKRIIKMRGKSYAAAAQGANHAVFLQVLI